MFFGFVFWIAVAGGEFLNPAFDVFLRLSGGRPKEMMRNGGKEVVLMEKDQGISVYEIDDTGEKGYLVFDLHGSNNYTYCKMIVVDSGIYILSQVYIVNVLEIPNLKVPDSLQLSTFQGLFIHLSLSYTLISSSLIGTCFSKDTYPHDLFSYSESFLILSINSCYPGYLILESFSISTFTLPFSVLQSKILIFNSNMYLIMNTEDIQVYKYDLFLKQQWNLTIAKSKMVYCSIENNSLWIVAEKSIIWVSEIGKIDYRKDFEGLKISGIYKENDEVLVFGTNPDETNTLNGVLIWANTQLSIKSQRVYLNVTNFIGILTKNNKNYVILIESKSNFYTSLYTETSESALIFTAKSPFEISSCNPACKNCFGASSDECFICKYYENTLSTSFSCGICDIACLTCLGPSSSDCIDCAIDYIKISDKCYKDLKCKDGTFQSLTQGSCASCHPYCLKCIGPSSNDCLSCSPGYILDQNTCLNKCPDGKFNNNGTCFLCYSTCLTCIGITENNCLSCNNGLHLYKNSCIIKCPDNTYNDNFKCFDCIENCVKCTSSGCSQCSNGFFLQNFICEPCSLGCSQCSSLNQCSICLEGYEIKSGFCISLCNISDFWNGSQCEPCDKACLKCNNNTNANCLQCSDGYIYNDNICVDPNITCPDYYYNSFGLCLPCSNNCVKCFDSTTCIKCEFSYSLINGICQNCLDFSCQCGDKCEQCDNGVCLKCIENVFLKNGICVDQCSEGDVIDNGICYCQDKCVICANDTCVHCVTGYVPENGKCVSCPENCFDCVTSNSCSQCIDGFYFYINTCVISCPYKYSPIDNICIQCSNNCETCTSTSCLKCIEDYSSYGYYDIISGQCSNNLTCINGFSYNINKGKCEQKNNENLMMKQFLESTTFLSKLFNLG
ncbi:hypothetical protein SteCoe_33558 [Stentor coeruleus]|uniref:EGF-like domain-containing protein n=1 Tax=Stentor coeruleus TaxID=5963 RepID=A0A1R2AWH1_9CILI|nr:hypothetical protein SteCoe_33558 [Stentor coeruleus]